MILPNVDVNLGGQYSGPPVAAGSGPDVRAARVGRHPPANLAVLKNGRAKAVRFTTLVALCEALDCQPGDLLRWEPYANTHNGRRPDSA